MRFKSLRQYADEAGIVAFVVVATVAVVLAFGAYFGGPEVKDELEGGPGIPPDLADHVSRGEGLERGEITGAAPNKDLPRPTSYLLDSGIEYEFKGSPNWSARGIGSSIEAIVIHVTGPGSMAGMASWFNNPSSQVSAHFGIGKKGEVQQYVEVGDAAWHAGVCNRWADVAARWCANHINPNRQTVGIELLLTPGEMLEQYAAMAQSLEQLMRWLLGVTGLEASRETIIGHFEIDSVNRSVDPRCCVDLDELVADLGGRNEPAADGRPRWNGSRWIQPDGWRFDPSVKGCCDGAQWETPDGRDWWSACTSWGGRKHLASGAYVHSGTPVYFGGLWATAPSC